MDEIGQNAQIFEEVLFSKLRTKNNNKQTNKKKTTTKKQQQQTNKAINKQQQKISKTTTTEKQTINSTYLVSVRCSEAGRRKKARD